MKHFSNINLNLNELQYAVIQNLNTVPITASIGQIYYDTTISKLKLYTAAGWVTIDSGGSSGIVGPGTINRVSKFTTTTSVGDSLIEDNASSVIVNRGTGFISSYTFDVNGTIFCDYGTNNVINVPSAININMPYYNLVGGTPDACIININGKGPLANGYMTGYNVQVSGPNNAGFFGDFSDTSAASIGIRLDSRPLHTGDFVNYNKYIGSTPTIVHKIDNAGNITSASYIKTGGTALEYLMADGSVTIGGGVPSGSAGGDLSGTYPNPNVVWANGQPTYDLVYYPLPTGTTLQYIDGTGAFQTFPTIPTVGTWGALNYPTWVSGTPFVKMTAAGTFALDTTVYYPNSNPANFVSNTFVATNYVPYTGATGSINIGANDIFTLGGAKLWDDGTVEGTTFQFVGLLGSLQSAASSNEAWLLPNQSGTIALLSDITAANNLDAVLTNGNISQIDAKVGGIFLYNPNVPSGNGYVYITGDKNRFNFYNNANVNLGNIQQDTLVLIDSVVPTRQFQIKKPAAIGANRIATFQDADGTVAYLSDIPVITNPTLDDVLFNGNVSQINANVGDIGIYNNHAPSGNGYVFITGSKNLFHFYNNIGTEYAQILQDTLILLDSSSSLIGMQIKKPASLTTNRVATFQDASGTVAYLSDIPAAQINSDWNAISGIAQILNKPVLAIVATSGDYNDLTNLPTIPAAQINSDWNATSGVAEILNKPTIPSRHYKLGFNNIPDYVVVGGSGVQNLGAGTLGMSLTQDLSTLSYVISGSNYVINCRVITAEQFGGTANQVGLRVTYSSASGALSTDQLLVANRVTQFGSNFAIQIANLNFTIPINYLGTPTNYFKFEVIMNRLPAGNTSVFSSELIFST